MKLNTVGWLLILGWLATAAYQVMHNSDKAFEIREVFGLNDNRRPWLIIAAVAAAVYFFGRKR